MEKIFRSTFYPLWITVLFAACNTNHSSEPATAEDGLVKGITTAQPAKKGIEKPAVYPVDAHLEMKILTTGTFHEEEVWEGAERENWTGLFKGKSGYYLAPTTIQTEKVVDPVVDEDESEKTGWQVRTSVTDSAILLMETRPSLRERNVYAMKLASDVLYPGDSLPFLWGGKTYELFATGVRKQEMNETIVENYNLYLSTVINDKRKTQLLVAEPHFEDNMIRVLFVGDIDGDKLPDLIIDTSPHYNMQRPTLYLSGAATEHELIKPVGTHRFVGC